MKLFPLVFLGVTSLFATTLGRPQTRIVGGIKAEKGEFPAIVSLRNIDFHFCGGSILNENFILSAGHCFKDTKMPLENIVVVAGDLKTGKDIDPNAQKRKLTSATVHPKFNMLQLKFDLSILRLDEPLQFTNLIQASVRATVAPQVGDKVTVTGWGVLQEGGHVASIDLMTTDLSVQKPTPCDITLIPILWVIRNDKSQICAAAPEGGHGSCQGDSGGPLYFNQKLCGIVSYGEGCGRKGKAGTYTNVAFHKAWIDKQLTRQSPGKPSRPKGKGKTKQRMM